MRDPRRMAWSTTMDRQHRLPHGLLGRLVGEQMVRQHQPETDWTVALLDLQPHDRAVELGCGAGRGLVLAARAAGLALVAGMDLSPTMLRAATRRVRRAGQCDQVSLLRGDLQALPYADGSLDKIWSVHTFYFWADPEAVFADLLRVLAPGGTVVVTLATGTVIAAGDDQLWPLHQQVETLVGALNRWAGISAEIQRGPNSRQFNNVAIVLRKQLGELVGDQRNAGLAQRAADGGAQAPRTSFATGVGAGLEKAERVEWKPDRCTPARYIGAAA